jgi:DNA-binding transcriptional LysR family regulator
MTMEWDDLKHFLAVARSGSLIEAARGLKSSPATVGRHIAALESKLGARLFDRQQTGYTLTESGEAIRLKAEDVEEAILSVEREAVGRDLRVTGKVRLAASDDVATHIVAPHLAQFKRSYPDISLDLIARMDLVNLTRREADIALRGMRPAQGDFIVRRAGSWPFGLYAAKTYAEAHELTPGKTDFSNAEIITWTEEWAHLRGGPWFVKHAPHCKIAVASDSRRVHQSACKAGVGIAILPCHLSDPDPDLIRLLPPERVLSVELWIVVHRDLARTARVRAVMDFITEVVPKYGS